MEGQGQQRPEELARSTLPVTTVRAYVEFLGPLTENETLCEIYHYVSDQPKGCPVLVKVMDSEIPSMQHLYMVCDVTPQGSSEIALEFERRYEYHNRRNLEHKRRKRAESYDGPDRRRNNDRRRSRSVFVMRFLCPLLKTNETAG